MPCRNKKKTRTTKNTLDRQRASAGRVYLQKLQKSCKKAITEAFTNYPALAVVTKENLEEMAAEASEFPEPVSELNVSEATGREELKAQVVAAANFVSAMGI